MQIFVVIGYGTYDYFQVGSDSVVLSRSFSTHYSDTMKVVRKFGQQGLKEQLTYYLDGDIWRMHNHVFYDDMGHERSKRF